MYLCIFLRDECALLRKELMERHQKESQAAMEELITRRESELHDEKTRWSERVRDLLNQVRGALMQHSAAPSSYRLHVA